MIRRRGRSSVFELPAEIAIVRQATVTLTNAQIKALPTTAVTLVNARGANTLIVPVSVTYRLHNAAGAYVSDPGATWHILLGAQEASAMIKTADMLAEPSTHLGWFSFDNNKVGTGDFADMVTHDLERLDFEWINLPLGIRDMYIGGNLDYTGGHASNTLRIAVAYMTLNILTGIYE